MSKNPLPIETERLLDQERFTNAAKAAGLQRVTFLAGPYIETAKAPRKSHKNRAALLRYKLFHYLDNEGWIVTLGEYEKLIDAAEPLFGDDNNAAVAEISHAKSKETDAIIMLPSSPGSFLELGAFAHVQEICPKMLVIVDKQYEKDTNYMNSGPVKEAANNGAKVIFLDYQDHEKCLSAVTDFTTKRARRKAARGVMV